MSEINLDKVTWRPTSGHNNQYFCCDSPMLTVSKKNNKIYTNKVGTELIFGEDKMKRILIGYTEDTVILKFCETCDEVGAVPYTRPSINGVAKNWYTTVKWMIPNLLPDREWEILRGKIEKANDTMYYARLKEK